MALHASELPDNDASPVVVEVAGKLVYATSPTLAYVVAGKNGALKRATKDTAGAFAVLLIA